MKITIEQNDGKVVIITEVHMIQTALLHHSRLLIVDHHGWHTEFFKTSTLKYWHVDAEGEYKPKEIDDRGILTIGGPLSEEVFMEYMKKKWEEDDASSQQG